MSIFKIPTCANCGSIYVQCPSDLRFDVALQRWVYQGDLLEDGYCNTCDKVVSLVEREATAQEIFDDLHAHQDGGTQEYLSQLDLARNEVMRLNGVTEEDSHEGDIGPMYAEPGRGND